MNDDSLRNKYRIIAKRKNKYVVANENLTKGFIIDQTGKHYTNLVSIYSILRENDWEIIDDSHKQIYDNKNFSSVDGLLGFAVGDALGVPFEFLGRNYVKKFNKGEMYGCDTHTRINSIWGSSIPAGSWSDDTSLLIAGMDSIIKNNGNINYDDVMNKYFKWWNNGEYISCDEPFGLGECVEIALNNYSLGKPTLECGSKDKSHNGNGSLMRIFPFSMYCIINNLNEKETCDIICNASKLTHGHEVSQMGCFIYTEFLKNIIETKNPKLSLENTTSIDYLKYFSRDTILSYKRLLHPSFYKTPEEEINSSGYIVHTLESVIYSVLRGNNYEETVMTAINLGEDTDSIGGISGSIAGMLYGQKSIPQNWINKLKKKDYLEKMGNDFEKVLKKTIINYETKENIKDKNNKVL